MQADLARNATEGEVYAWRQFEVLPPAQMGAPTQDVQDTRWALTWKNAEGKKMAKARLVPKGYQNQDLKDRNLEIAGCASRRSSHLQLISLGALRIWRILGLEIKNAFLRAAGFGP